MQDHSSSTAGTHPPEQHSIFAVWRWKPWKFRLMIGMLLLGYVLAPMPVLYGIFAYGWNHWNPEEWKRAMLIYDIAFFPLQWARFNFDAVAEIYSQQMRLLYAVCGPPIPPEADWRPHFMIRGLF